IADLAPILFALLMTITYRVYDGFVYDHSELFLFTGYLLFSWDEQWGLLLPTLVLAILNKETAILFPLFGIAIALRKGHLSKRRIHVLLVEILILAVGFVAIHHMMRNRIGTPVEWH